MLHQSIIKHPYFNEELNEASAKEHLKNSTEGNFLFCKGTKNNEIILLYKAFYRGAEEVRVLKLNCDSSGGVSSTSLGSHSSLYSVPQALTKYLDGWTSSPFTPMHFLKAGEIWARKVVKELQPITGLDVEIVKHHIFPFFNSATLGKTALVSKTWAALSYEEKPAQVEREQLAEKKAILRSQEMIKDIYKVIKGMSPAPEGEGKPYNRLQYEGFTISEPMWYGSIQIICKLSTPTYSKYIKVREGAADIDVLQEGGSLNSNDLNKLHELCTHSTKDSQYEEEDSEVNALVFK